MSRTDDLAASLGQLAETRVPGGCDDCQAFQVITPDPGHPRVWHCQIFHDDSCPTFRAMRRPR